MPPEPSPWDRKGEFFREQKHGTGYGYGYGHGYDYGYGHHHGNSLGGGGGGGGRWRDSSSPFAGSRYNSQFSPRWGFPSSDIRRPPGHGKQVRWHMYSEDSPHGYSTPLSGNRFLDDCFRPSGPHGDGKYGRMYRENRNGFGQRDWRGHSWENNHQYSGSANTPSRQHNMHDQRSVGDSPAHSSDLNSGPNYQSQPKDQADIAGDNDGSGTSLKDDKEKQLGSLDWKPLKWSRSGSLTSRGSGFSHSTSSSKSTGGESTEVKCDLPPKRVTPVQSPTVEAAACAPTGVSSEETASRKKPRLGWGEGLAKYEMKKVDGPYEDLNKAENTISALTSNSADKSPKITGFYDSASPATPSSSACSSSPEMEEKTYVKASDCDVNDCCESSMPVPEVQPEGVQFCLEKLELNSITNLSSLLSEVLQVDQQCSVDSGFMRSSAFSKLLLWKGDISKVIELTAAETDSFENELKLLKADYAQGFPCPVSSSCSAVTDRNGYSEGQNGFARPPPLDVVLSGNIEGDTCEYGRLTRAESNDADIDSPGTTTSNSVGSLPLQKPVTACLADRGFGETSKSIPGCLLSCIFEEATVGASCQGDDANGTGDDNAVAVAEPSGVRDKKVDSVCDIILACNKEIAAEASEMFSKLLPCHNHGAVSLQATRPADVTIKDKFLMRKRRLRLKEKLMSLKYRAFHHLWKEDLCLLSLRSNRVKPQKKLDLTSRTKQIGCCKHRPSIRSRFASPAGSLILVPTAETLNFTRKLISDSEVKIYRNSLKMPAMILEEKEKMSSRFVSKNGLVEDPLAVEKERSLLNPWTIVEKKVYMEKLAAFGKDFSKIASFLDHKTTADCIEFYYKNHKSQSFEKTKHLDVKKEYMVTSEKKRNREVNVVSLDILGEASAIAAQVDEAMETSKLLPGKSSNRKARRSDGFTEASNKFDLAEDERETAAADVLAGICGSLSSEAMSSGITSLVDPGEGSREWKHPKVGSSTRWRLTPDVTQIVDDDNCSDEICGEMDPFDWTDDEKSLFVRAFSSHGKDFLTISRLIRSKTKDQCKVFFSKARKCLGLDTLHPGSCRGGTLGSNYLNEGGSDIEDACVVETESVACSDNSGSRMDEDLPHMNDDVSMPDASCTNLNVSEAKCVPEQLDYKETDMEKEDLCAADNPADSDVGPGGVVDAQDKKPSGAQRAAEGRLISKDNTTELDVATCVNAGLPPQVLNVVRSESTFEANNLKAVPICHDGDPHSLIAPVESCELQDGRLKQSAERELQNPLCGNSSPNEVEASIDLKSFPLDLSIKAEMSDVIIHKAVSESKFSSFQECCFKKCSRLASQNAATELPFLKNAWQTKDFSSTSEMDESCSSGDVKLFGKILSKPSSVDNPTSSVQQHEKKAKHYPTPCGKSSTKATCQGEISKHDQNCFVGLENVPIRSYGYWDGTKTQTGFPSLIESAQLLSKYPAAFGNYSSTLPRAEQQPVQAAVTSHECNINGACLFSPRDYSRSTVGSVIDYPSFSDEETQLFTLDVKRRQDAFPEVPRNGFEAIPSLQPQQNGLVNLNVVQGDISYMGISDPMAALRLHYSCQLSGGSVHTANKVSSEDSWRGQRDVGW